MSGVDARSAQRRAALFLVYMDNNCPGIIILLATEKAVLLSGKLIFCYWQNSALPLFPQAASHISLM